VAQLSLSEAARRLLTEGVGSLERLDLLLFLHRQPARWWSARALEGELDRPADALRRHLDHLVAQNLLDVRIAESVVYRYQPGRDDLAAQVEELARENHLHRDAVATLLARRLGESARLFANAFQLRRGKRDG
jgi:predicted ArsR family transcriptional regulator